MSRVLRHVIFIKIRLARRVKKKKKKWSLDDTVGTNFSIYYSDTIFDYFDSLTVKLERIFQTSKCTRKRSMGKYL